MAKPIGSFGTTPSLPEEWFDGQAWLLVAGEDYEHVTKIRAQLQAQAKRMGLFLKTRAVTGGLAIAASNTPVRGPRKANLPAAVAEPAPGPSHPYAEDQNLIDPDVNDDVF